MEIEEILPLSPLQRGLLFHAISDDSEDYLTQIELCLEGRLDISVLRNACSALLERHPALRAGIWYEGLNTPVQVVAAWAEPAWRQVAVGSGATAARERAAEQILAEERSSKFDLTRPPLIKFALIRTAPEQYRLLITVHHIMLDGWSTPLLIQELFAHYAAGGRASVLPAVAAYRDYFAWLATQDSAASTEAWRGALAGGIEPALLGAWPATPGLADNLARNVELSSSATAALVRTARTAGVTLGTLVQGAWAVMLGHLLNREEVVFGTTTALRPEQISGIERIIGPLINTTPVRVRVSPVERVTDLMRRIQIEQTDLLSHRHLSLAEIQRQSGAAELFDTLVVFDSYPAQDSFSVTGDLRVAKTVVHGAPHYPLTLIVTAGERLRLQFLLKPSVLGIVAEHIVGRLTRLLEEIAAAPDLHVGDVQFADSDDRRMRGPRVLDGALRPVPPGCVGELHLPRESSESVADPDSPGEWQPTGELARLNADRTFHVIGRVDALPRVGGRWIVLEDVEAVLCRRPEVRAAAMAVHELRPGDRRLAAYVVVEGVLDERAIRRHMAARLPAHCVPAVVVALDAIPFSAGKPDRTALPVPSFDKRLPAGAPTACEETLCRLFGEVLGSTEVRLDDSFFDLGGHSLAATRLVSRIREELGVGLEIYAVFEFPTPAALAERVEESGSASAGAGEPVRPQLVRRPRSVAVPASFAQHRLWFLGRLDGPGATYNLPIVFRLADGIDSAALRAAIADVVSRHEVLRTVLPEVDGAPRQVVLDSDRVRIPWSVSDVPAAELPRALEVAAAEGFELESEVPLRVFLFRTEQDCVLLILLHHVAGDEWSFRPLVRDLGVAYTARQAGAAPAWAPLPVQYADYTLWQRELLGDVSHPESMFARQIAYWRQTLAGAPAELSLGCARPRPAGASGHGGSVSFAIDGELAAAAEALARDCGATLFMVLHAGVAALLSRFGAGTDIVVGAPVAGRTDADLEDLVGFFVNTLVLRVDTGGNPTFRALIERVRGVDLAAYAHQDVPFEAIVEALNPPRVPGRNPLFQLALTLENTGSENLTLPGLAASVNVDMELGRAQFDLAFTLVEDPSSDRIAGKLDYASDLFEHFAAVSLADCFIVLLEQLVLCPDVPIEAAAMVPIEAATPVAERGSPDAGLTEATLPDLFETVVAASSDAVAVTGAAGDLTYAELADRADRLARLLIARGIGAEDIVAIALDRGPDVVVAILGVLKSGAAYLPVDPDYPAERIAFMLDDAAPALVVTNDFLAAGLPATVPQLSLTGLDAGGPAPVGALVRHRPLHPDNAAYLIYTSGSTGSPKGVVVTHRSVVRLIAATAEWVRPRPTDVWTLFHSYSFDFSVWELWGALLHGGRLVTVPHEVTRTPRDFRKLLEAEGVTVLSQTPSAFDQLMIADAETPQVDTALALRAVVFGGEALQPSNLRGWFERHGEEKTDLVNMYGLTETTVHATAFALSPVDLGEPAVSGSDARHVVGAAVSPIGRALSDLRVRLLDSRLRPVPPGMVGEVYVSGPGLARGYLNRSAVTAARFIADLAGTGERMYRTGDLARVRCDGVLDYAGRADDQVKIRGFRVELGEIRHVLAEHRSVSDAVVTVRTEGPGDQRLVGYVVPALGATVSPVALREHLRQRLPAHMVPGAVTVIEKIPLTPNGKTDFRGLPTPSYDLCAGARSAASPREQILCGLFAEVLGLAVVGPDDSFFERGGHSLLATRLTVRVGSVLGIDVPIHVLFQHPSPAALAEWLHGQAADTSAGAFAPVLALRSSGSASPLWCIHPVGGLSWSYAGLLPYIDADHPVFGLQARGLMIDEDLPRSVAEMADEYVARITQVSPSGPHYLLGWSLGGVVAQAIATRLERRGDRVALLIMLDSQLSAAPEDRSEDNEFVAALAEAHRSVEGIADADAGLARRLAEVVDNNTRLNFRFLPDPVTCPTVLITVEDSLADEAWRPYVPDSVEIHRVAAGHYEMLGPAALERIGPILAAGLAAGPV